MENLSCIFHSRGVTQYLFEQVVDRAEVLFSEVDSAISQIVENKYGGAVKNGVVSAESRNKIMELERALRNDKMEFEVLLYSKLARCVALLNQLCCTIMWEFTANGRMTFNKYFLIQEKNSSLSKLSPIQKP